MLVALVAVMAFGAVAASGASALEFQIEGKPLGGTEPIIGAKQGSETARVALNLDGSQVVFACKQTPATGGLGTKGTLQMAIALEECTLTEPVGCKLPTAEEKQIMLYADGQMESLVKVFNEGAGVGEEVLSFGIEGGQCAFSASFSVAGYWKCAFPKGSEEKIEHEEVCTKGTSFLKWGTETGTLAYTEQIKLASGKKWGVVE